MFTLLYNKTKIRKHKGHDIGSFFFKHSKTFWKLNRENSKSWTVFSARPIIHFYLLDDINNQLLTMSVISHVLPPMSLINYDISAHVNNGFLDYVNNQLIYTRYTMSIIIHLPYFVINELFSKDKVKDQ